MDQLSYQLEVSAFDEKIALAELEASKAAERVKELIYQKARFNMEWMRLVAKEQEQKRANQVSVMQVQKPAIPSPVSCNCGPNEKCDKCTK